MTDRKFVDVPAGRIAYTESGDPDASVALYVHGVILNSYLWRHQLNKFAGIRRNIAVDLLGHGHTVANPGNTFTFDNQAEMLLQVLDALGIAEVDLVGNDSGTGIAQIFAVNHGDRVRSLVLTNGDVHDNWPPEAFAGVIAAVNAGQLPQIIDQLDTNHDFYRSPEGLGAGYQYPDKVSDAEIDAFITPYVDNPRQQADLTRFFGAFDNRQTVSIEPKLRDLTVPTLVVWGTADVFFPARWAQWLADTIPGVRRVELIDDAALALNEERADEVNDAITAHWNSFLTD